MCRVENDSAVLKSQVCSDNCSSEGVQSKCSLNLVKCFLHSLMVIYFYIQLFIK